MKVNLNSNYDNKTSFKMAVMTKKSAINTMSRVAVKENFTDLINGVAALTQEQADNNKVDVIVKKAGLFSSKIKFLIKNAMTNANMMIVKQKDPKDIEALNTVKSSIEIANQVVEGTQKLTTKLPSRVVKKA